MINNSVYIDQLVDRIQQARTRDYFSEVIGSYYNGNFRSAIVMLYSVVICDLVYKLVDLRDIYGNDKASKLLEKIEKEQHDNPSSSQWEKTMVDRMYNSHLILMDNPTYAHIAALRDDRNLCAHPALSGSLNLYMPKEANVKSHIVNMLEEVLTKPSFQIKDFCNIILDDIAANKLVLQKEEDLFRYVTNKYLKPLNSAELEYALFNLLWKFVFKIDNADCDANRRVNLKMMKLLFGRNTDVFLVKIALNAQFLSKNIDRGKQKCMMCFIHLMNKYPKIFKQLPSAEQSLLEQFIKGNTKYSALSFFLFDDPLSHAGNIDNTISIGDAKYAYRYIYDSYGEPEALDFAVNHYGGSRCYDEADERYDELVYPNLSLFTIKQLKAIMDYSESNSQIYDRRKFGSSRNDIKAAVKEKQPDFDFSGYVKFK